MAGAGNEDDRLRALQPVVFENWLAYSVVLQLFFSCRYSVVLQLFWRQPVTTGRRQAGSGAINRSAVSPCRSARAAKKAARRCETIRGSLQGHPATRHPRWAGRLSVPTTSVCRSIGPFMRTSSVGVVASRSVRSEGNDGERARDADIGECPDRDGRMSTGASCFSAAPALRSHITGTRRGRADLSRRPTGAASGSARGRRRPRSASAAGASPRRTGTSTAARPGPTTGAATSTRRA